MKLSVHFNRKLTVKIDSGWTHETWRSNVKNGIERFKLKKNEQVRIAQIRDCWELLVHGPYHAYREGYWW